VTQILGSLWEWNDLVRHWEEELDVPILTNRRAMLFSARKLLEIWGVEGATTPA
jgi:hypothetical protein